MPKAISYIIGNLIDNYTRWFTQEGWFKFHV